MPLSIIIEDGTGVDAAQCYGPTTGDIPALLTAARAYAALRGVTLTTDDEVVIQLIHAMDYLECRTEDYVGERVSPDQPLSWPRKCVKKSDGTPFPEDELPVSLLSALYQLCVEQANGIVLVPTVAGSEAFVTSERVDVIEVKYSQKIIPLSQPMMPIVEALLETITNPSAILRSIRV